MSLNDLIHQYNAAGSIDEKLALLDAIAAHLPAPEFLWYPLALQALAEPEPRLRQASLRLLANAPQAWDQLVVAALTNPDAEFQSGALHALAMLASRHHELAAAFDKLGALPGWLAESLLVWERLRPAPAPQQASLEAPEAGLWEVFEHRLREVGEELSELKDERTTLRGQLDQESRWARELSGRLQALGEEHQALKERHSEVTAATARTEEAHQGQLDALRKEHENQTYNQQQLMRSLQEALAQADAARARLFKASAAAMVVLGVVGGGAGFKLGSHTNGQTAAAHQPSITGIAGDNHTRIAEAEGYQRALDALEARARDLARQGYYQPAMMTWQTYAKIASDPQAVIRAQHEAALLFDRMKPAHVAAASETSADTALHVAASPRPTALVAAAPRRVVRPLVHHVVHHVFRPALPQPPEPPADAAPTTAQESAPVIPDQIRAKF